MAGWVTIETKGNTMPYDTRAAKRQKRISVQALTVHYLDGRKSRYFIDGKRCTQTRLDDLKNDGNLDTFHTTMRNGIARHFCRIYWDVTTD